MDKIEIRNLTAERNNCQRIADALEDSNSIKEALLNRVKDLDKKIKANGDTTAS